MFAVFKNCEISIFFVSNERIKTFVFSNVSQISFDWILNNRKGSKVYFSVIIEESFRFETFLLFLLMEYLD